MKTINVNLSSTYPIYIGRNIVASNKLIAMCKKLGNTIVIIADSNVRALYGQPLLKSLKEKRLQAHLLSFPAGEKNKTRQTKELLENTMLKLGCGRDTCVVAIGGGVTTDLAGFIASTYCRGIPVIYVPTSLLAMVDAGIGGKTGVDTPFGKNLIGTFYQPKAVFIDLNTLATLPAKEFRSGMAEIIKHALIKDKTLLDFLIKHAAKINQLNPSYLQEIVYRSSIIKKELIEKDETESGIRQLCNFGHTVGHAIELISNYKINHGQSVALGMVAESFISVQLGFLKLDDFIKVLNTLHQFLLATTLSAKYPLSAINKVMSLDKKAKGQVPYFVLLDKIGKPHISKFGYSMPVSEELIAAALNFLLIP